MKNHLWITLGITFFSFIIPLLTQAQPPEAGNINDVDHTLVSCSATPPPSFLNRKDLPEALMVEILSFLSPIEITPWMNVDQDFYKRFHQLDIEKLWIRFANAFYSSQDSSYYEKNSKNLNLILNRFFVRIQPVLEYNRIRKKIEEPLPEVKSLIDLSKLYPHERAILLRVICGATHYDGDREQDRWAPKGSDGRTWHFSLRGNENLIEINMNRELRIFAQGPRLIPLLRYLGADPNGRDVDDGIGAGKSDEFSYRSAVHCTIQKHTVQPNSIPILQLLSIRGGIDFYRKSPPSRQPHTRHSIHEPLLHFILQSGLHSEEKGAFIHYLLSLQANPLLSRNSQGQLPSGKAREEGKQFLHTENQYHDQANTLAFIEELEKAEENFRMAAEEALPEGEIVEETKLPETALSLTSLSAQMP